MPNGEEYWRGQFEANIQSLFNLTGKLASSIDRLELKLEELNSWRWRLVGTCTARSSLMAALISLLALWMR